MKLTQEGNTFVCVTSYEERAVPKTAGFRWDPNKRRWWTSDVEKAARLSHYADDALMERLSSQLNKHLDAIKASKAITSDLVIPAPAGLSYMPFQRAGVQYALQHSNVLIGDEMGLGKTIQALGVVNVLQPKKILIVCPASLKLNWRREFLKWVVQPYKLQLVTSKDRSITGDVVVINYDILNRHESLQTALWDLLIVDECHYVKNSRARRTKLVTALRATKKLYMTGTPIVNRPIELWPILNALDADTWKSFWSFAKRYCGAYHNGYGWDLGGASNLDELQAKLRKTVLVRRLKSEVLTELPPKVKQVIELPATEATKKAIQKELDQWNEHEAKIEELRRVVRRLRKEAKENETEYRTAVRALHDEQQVAFNAMAAFRHATAVAKVPFVLEHLEVVLDCVDKVVIWTWHHDVTDAIEEGLNGILSRSERTDVRQVAGDQKRGERKVSTGQVELPLSSMRPHRASSSDVVGSRHIKRVHPLSSDEARKGTYSGVSNAGRSKVQSKSGGSSVQSNDRRHSDTKEVSSFGYTVDTRRATQSGYQSFTGQDRAEQGVRKEQHLGDLLEGEQNQKQRNSVGTQKNHAVVVFDGRTSMMARQAAVDAFQTDPKCRVFIGSITAAGVGITLTAAAHVVFAELDWTPGNMKQAEDRCHRIGQHDSVLVQYLVLEDSLDARLANTAVDKTEVIEQALDVEKKVQPTAEQLDPQLGKIREAEQVAKDAIEAKRQKSLLDADVERLPVAQVAAIHKAMKILAANCDGARTWDAAGFNKLDAAFGKSIAMRAQLTDRQARAAMKLVMKYHGQLDDGLVEKATGKKLTRRNV